METREPEYLRDLVRELCALPTETEWVEFKVGNTEPEGIGKRISALANGAALQNEATAYMVWGIEDKTHDVVGTSFSYETKKQGNQQLESWLRSTVSTNIDFRFHGLTIDDLRIVILEIASATQHPVNFRNIEYVRVGQSTEPLTKHPRIAARLWQTLSQTRFEDGIAEERLNDEQVLDKLDFNIYFTLLREPLPDGRINILDSLRRDNFIRKSQAGGWDITNLGSILLARHLSDFPSLRHKSLRLIKYNGLGRSTGERDWFCEQGYAAGFQRIIDQTMAFIPANEVLDGALKVPEPMVPERAIRELVANALIHQDFEVSGSRALIEIFDDRVEISNPGKSLVEADRLLNARHRSRNEDLAEMMRQFRICELRGSGIDEVMRLVEETKLPAPDFRVFAEATVAILFARKTLTMLNKEERVRACYWHACLRYETHQPTNNRSIRERFGIPANRPAQATRLLNEVVDEGRLVIADPSVGNKSRAYLPSWAAIANDS